VSVTDPADDVQPEDPGQGDPGTQGAPYQEYLDRIPEELRGDVEPVFRDWDGQVTKRFQDQAEFRKQWEPFSETGVSQLSPEDASYAVQLFQAMADPQTMKQWWDGYSQANGLTPDQQQQQQQQQPQDQQDDYGFQDPSQQQFEKLLEDKLGPLMSKLEAYDGRFEQQDQQAAMAEASQFIEGQLSELKGKHGEFDKDTEELINTLAGRYIESDPMNAIPRAYDDLQRWQNQYEKTVLQGKVDAPAPAETGGVPDVSPEQHRSIEDPRVKDAAIEFLRNSNRA
jgi:hypothetical protein